MPTPFTLSLVLTHACNLACRYCYMGEHHRAAMPLPIAEKALRWAIARHDRVDLGFFGGEPLLEHTRLLTIADQARALADAEGSVLRMQVTTNGTLLDDAALAELHARAVHVTLSLDGTRDAHDAGRVRANGRSSSFDDVVAAARRLAASAQGLDVIAVVTPANVRFLGASVDFLASLGARRITLNPDYGGAFTDDDLGIWEHELGAVARTWEGLRRSGRGPAITNFDRKVRAAVAGGVSLTEACSRGRRNVAVAPSGNLYPCERLVRDDRPTHAPPTRSLLRRSPSFVVGHVDARFPAHVDALSLAPDEDCRGCAEQWRCSATCVCANLAETGEASRPGGIQCWHDRTIARLVDDACHRLVDARAEAFVAWAYPALAPARDAEVPTMENDHEAS